MAHVYVRHKIKDYDSWKKGFDAAHEIRKQSGEKSMAIYHVDGDRGDLIGIAEYDDVAKARAFFDSPELKAKMEEAGVIGPPEIVFLESY
jgi:hypothetical protein